ncbi:MAG: hypothetical protein AAF386_04595 [Pseudomonadota bacterium]
MNKTVGFLVLVLACGGCARLADSPVNPVNWFGRSTPVESADAIVQVDPIIPASARTTQIVDGRALIETVERLDVQDVSGGVLITAQGRTARSGGYNVQLVRTGIDGTTLSLAFRVQYPATQSGGSGQLITASQFLSNKDVRGIRRIVVQGAQTSLSRSN